MNIILRELKTNRKAFIFWMIGMFCLIFIGMFKYTGFKGDSSIMEIFDTMPRVIVAVFGMVGVDFTKIGGYYSLLAYYTMICAVIYGIHLGAGAVTREAVDKTYEFIFTKPKSRTYILQMKLIAAMFYLVLFHIGTFLISLLAVSAINTGESIPFETFLFTIACFLVSTMFFMLAVCLAAYAKKEELGMRFGNLCFLLFFIISMIYDMLENGGILKVLAPFKYFASWDILEGKFDMKYVVLCIVVTSISYFWAIKSFEKKDFLS